MDSGGRRAGRPRRRAEERPSTRPWRTRHPERAIRPSGAAGDASRGPFGGDVRSLRRASNSPASCPTSAHCSALAAPSRARARATSTTVDPGPEGGPPRSNFVPEVTVSVVLGGPAPIESSKHVEMIGDFFASNPTRATDKNRGTAAALPFLGLLWGHGGATRSSRQRVASSGSFPPLRCACLKRALPALAGVTGACRR
jgi:hypothetical protein